MTCFVDGSIQILPLAFDADIGGSVAKFGFSSKIEKLGTINSMTYRIPNSSKTNFATEPIPKPAVPECSRYSLLGIGPLVK